MDEKDAKIKFLEKSDALGNHLNSINKKPILSKHETLELSYKVKEWMDLERIKDFLSLLSNKNATYNDLAYNQSISLQELEKIIKEGQKAKNLIFEGNLRLVVSIAKKYSNNSNKLELNDLVQAGYLGLHRAIEKFDPYLGWQFSTYAYHWVRQAVCKTLSEQSQSLRVPNYVQTDKAKLLRINSELKAKLGRSPSFSELAEEADMNEDRVLKSFRYTQPIVSLDYLVGKDKDTSYFNVVADDKSCPEDTLSTEIAKKSLNDLLDSISPDKASILKLRFGIGSNNTKLTSFVKIGQVLGIKDYAKIKRMAAEAESELKLKCGIVDEEYHYYFLAFLDLFFRAYTRLMHCLLNKLVVKRSQLENNYYNWSYVLDTLSE